MCIASSQEADSHPEPPLMHASTRPLGSAAFSRCHLPLPLAACACDAALPAACTQPLSSPRPQRWQLGGEAQQRSVGGCVKWGLCSMHACTHMGAPCQGGDPLACHVRDTWQLGVANAPSRIHTTGRGEAESQVRRMGAAADDGSGQLSLWSMNIKRSCHETHT